MKNKELMSKLKHYLSLNYPMVVTRGSDWGYVVNFPDLQGCVAIEKTLARAIKLAEDFKRAWIEDALEAGHPIPEPKEREEYSGKFIVRLPSYLHQRLSEQAEREKRSLNQHITLLLSERSAALSINQSVIKIAQIEDKLQGHCATLERATKRFTYGAACTEAMTIGRGFGTQSRSVSNIHLQGGVPC